MVVILSCEFSFADNVKPWSCRIRGLSSSAQTPDWFSYFVMPQFYWLSLESATKAWNGEWPSPSGATLAHRGNLPQEFLTSVTYSQRSTKVKPAMRDQNTIVKDHHLTLPAKESVQDNFTAQNFDKSTLYTSTLKWHGVKRQNNFAICIRCCLHAKGRN